MKFVRVRLIFLVGLICVLMMLFLCLCFWVNRVEFIRLGKSVFVGMLVVMVVGLVVVVMGVRDIVLLCVKVLMLLWCRWCFLLKVCISMLKVLVLFLKLNRVFNCGLVFLGRLV